MLASASLMRSGFAPGLSILLMAKTMGTLAAAAWLMASMVWGMMLSSAAMMMMAMMEGQRLHSLKSEIQWLRRWHPRFFSQRVLAAAYGVSQRQIRNAIEEEDGHGDQGDESAT